MTPSVILEEVKKLPQKQAMKLPKISVDELESELGSDAKPFVLDVREENEFQICRLPDSKLIPLGVLPERYHELDKDQNIVVHCHHGGRSAKAIQFLQTKGFKNLRNLVGGIDAWSEQIDSSVPRY